jgi:hypothetical protein
MTASAANVDAPAANARARRAVTRNLRARQYEERLVSLSCMGTVIAATSAFEGMARSVSPLTRSRIGKSPRLTP